LDGSYRALLRPWCKFMPYSISSKRVILTINRWIVGLALLADTVPQERLAQAMGYVGMGMSVGILVGPLLGGVVYDRAGYNAVFAMAYSLVGIDIVLRLLLVEKKVAARWDSEVVGRQRLTTEATPQTPRDPEATAGVGSGSSEKSGSKDVSSSTAATPDPEKAVFTAPEALSVGLSEEVIPRSATAVPRRRRRDRLPPILSLLYSRRLLAALFAAIMQAAVMTSFDSVLTLHAANTFHWSSTGAALLFLPIVIPSAIGPLVGWLADRYGGRYLATTGFLFTLPPLVCLRYIQSNTMHDKVLLCALLALIGLFLTLTFPPIMAEISAVVEAKEKKMLANGEKGYGKGGAYAQAYALFNMAFAAGCVIGPLLAGFIVQEKGWATMAWVLGLLSGITAVPTVLWFGGFLFGKR
jgi:MFS family permease